jgi:hypothetical protein
MSTASDTSRSTSHAASGAAGSAAAFASAAAPAPSAKVAIVPAEAPLRDIMQGAARWQIPALDHGFVALVDCMPRMIPEGKTATSPCAGCARELRRGHQAWSPKTAAWCAT